MIVSENTQLSVTRETLFAITCINMKYANMGTTHKKLILTKTSLLLAGTAHAKQPDFVEVRLFAASLISDQITHQF